MSRHEEILAAAEKILQPKADVSIELEMPNATLLKAVARERGYTESKSIVHGLGYLTDVRIWAASFLKKIT